MKRDLYDDFVDSVLSPIFNMIKLPFQLIHFIISGEFMRINYEF